MTQTRSCSSAVHPGSADHAADLAAGHSAGFDTDNTTRPRRLRMRSTLSVLCGAALLAALTACSPGVPLVTGAPSTPPVVAPSAEPTTEPTVAPEPEPTTTPTTTPTPEPTPITLGCTDLVPLGVMYDFNPNFGTDPDYQPAAGSAAAQMAAAGGVACGWINQSSSEEIEIAVASMDDDALGAAYENAMANSTPVPLYGTEGFFSTDGDVGEAQAFTPEYWLIARSTAFVEASDAQNLVNVALSALPAS